MALLAFSDARIRNLSKVEIAVEKESRQQPPIHGIHDFRGILVIIFFLYRSTPAGGPSALDRHPVAHLASFSLYIRFNAQVSFLSGGWCETVCFGAV